MIVATTVGMNFLNFFFAVLQPGRQFPCTQGPRNRGLRPLHSSWMGAREKRRRKEESCCDWVSRRNKSLLSHRSCGLNINFNFIEYFRQELVRFIGSARNDAARSVGTVSKESKKFEVETYNKIFERASFALQEYQLDGYLKMDRIGQIKWSGTIPRENQPAILADALDIADEANAARSTIQREVGADSRKRPSSAQQNDVRPQKRVKRVAINADEIADADVESDDEGTYAGGSAGFQSDPVADSSEEESDGISSGSESGDDD